MISNETQRGAAIVGGSAAVYASKGLKVAQRLSLRLPVRVRGPGVIVVFIHKYLTNTLLKAIKNIRVGSLVGRMCTNPLSVKILSGISVMGIVKVCSKNPAKDFCAEDLDARPVVVYSGKWLVEPSSTGNRSTSRLISLGNTGRFYGVFVVQRQMNRARGARVLER